MLQMDNLYALVIGGKMYYCLGMITDSLLESVDLLAKQMKIKFQNNENPCVDFCLLLKEKYGIVLTPINISYVFRN